MNISWQFFRFPFDDKRWPTKALIGGLLTLLGFIIWPLLLPVWGYNVRIARRTIQGELPSLPDWDDWGDLFTDGVRFFIVGLVYMLPVALIGCCAYIGLFSAAGIPLIAEDSPALGIAGMMASYGIFYFLLGVLVLLGLPLVLLASVAVTRMVAHDSLGSAFEFGQVWQLARVGFSNYLMALIVSYGASYLISMLTMGLAYTLILACLLPIIWGFSAFYAQALMGALFGAAYYHSQASSPSSERESTPA